VIGTTRIEGGLSPAAFVAPMVAPIGDKRGLSLLPSIPAYPKHTLFYSRHSHSMVLSHGNALIFQRNFFLLTVKARLASRQNFSLMISK